MVRMDCASRGSGNGTGAASCGDGDVRRRRRERAYLGRAAEYAVKKARSYIAD